MKRGGTYSMNPCENYLKEKHESNINIACKQYPTIIKKSLKKHEKELYNEPYLPRHLLYELNVVKYFENLKENNLFEEYKKQFFKKPHKLRTDLEVKEFYEWVQKHKKYEDLLHKDNYNKLTNNLDMINHIQENIINDFIDKGYLKKRQ